jgi:endonuclease/exonuclease/phosphatase (EEP) superfamily protein YafD
VPNVRDKKHRVSLLGLLQATAFFTILLSLLTGFGIPDHRIELFSHFRLQYFVVSLLLLCAFAYLRSYGYAGALAIVAVFNASLVLPWYLADVDGPEVEGTPLKIIHVNVHSANTGYERLTDFIAKEQPDIVVLQEVNAEWVAGTQGLLAEYPHTYIQPRQGNFGIAAFSRIPFDSITHVDSPPLSYPTIVATITVASTPVTLISTHPTIPVNRHLYRARNTQFDSIAELVNQASGDVVLIGDFNASVWDQRFRDFKEATGLRNVRRGFGILPSWPTFLPFAMIPIDHALVSKDIGVVDVRTGNNIGSDHLPLIVTLSL